MGSKSEFSRVRILPKGSLNEAQDMCDGMSVENWSASKEINSDMVQ